MTLDFNLFGIGKPKPVANRGTRIAFAAGRRMLKKNGVNPHLKEAVKSAMRNSQKVVVQVSVAGAD